MKIKCQEIVHRKHTKWGVYDNCDKNAKWLITSTEHFGMTKGPYRKYVCSYHKKEITEHFERINFRYNVELIK